MMGGGAKKAGAASAREEKYKTARKYKRNTERGGREIEAERWQIAVAAAAAAEALGLLQRARIQLEKRRIIACGAHAFVLVADKRVRSRNCVTSRVFREWSLRL